MTDILTPLKLAILQRLQGEVGAPVFDHVPDNQRPPVVVLDRFGVTNDGDKSGDMLLVDLTVQVIAQGRSRDEHRAIMAAVQSRLSGWRPSVSDVLCGQVLLISTGEQTLGDGLTHLGDVQVQVFAQPA